MNIQGNDALLINVERVNFKNKQTGEINTMYSCNYAVKCEPCDGRLGDIILNSYAPESAYPKLQSTVGKRCKIFISEKPIFGKTNTYKKVVSKIDEFSFKK